MAGFINDAKPNSQKPTLSNQDKMKKLKEKTNCDDLEDIDDKFKITYMTLEERGKYNIRVRDELIVAQRGYIKALEEESAKLKLIIKEAL